MALQLKNKVAKDKPTDASGKKGKYKRKRNVFGKKLFRFGLVGTIIVLILGFVAIKTIFTIQQNNKQKKIDRELEEVNKNIKDYKRKLQMTPQTYENVGKLIATLPMGYDQQALSLDIDRIVILSGLKETKTSRKIDPTSMPFEIQDAEAKKTVKAVKITLSLTTGKDDYGSVLGLVDLLSKYDHENFYYIEKISYKEGNSRENYAVVYLEMYTFYNEIQTTTQTNTTTTK